MYSLRYLRELSECMEIRQDSNLIHLSLQDCSEPAEKLKIIFLINSILNRPVSIIVSPENLTEWEFWLNAYKPLSEKHLEILTGLPEALEGREIYIDTDIKADGPFVFSFTDASEPQIPSLQPLYDRMIQGDWSEDSASKYVKAYEELARISGSLRIPYRKVYLKACRILDRKPVGYNILPKYSPTEEDLCQKIAEESGFDQIDVLERIDEKIPGVIKALTDAGELLDLSCYPVQMFNAYHYDQVFDQAVIEADALRPLAIAGKYEEVKEAFKEKISRV